MALHHDKMALHRDKMALHHDKMALHHVETQYIASLLALHRENVASIFCFLHPDRRVGGINRNKTKIFHLLPCSRVLFCFLLICKT
jgi:hypothetical protein